MGSAYPLGGTLAIRDKLADGATSYLRPDERIQATFMALSGRQSYNDVGVVVSDQRIMLFSLTMTGALNEFLSQVDRGTRIGPAHGLMLYATSALGPALSIHRRFFRDVAAADAAIDDHSPWQSAPTESTGLPGSSYQESAPPDLAGWYPDPADESRTRQFDGTHWGPWVRAGGPRDTPEPSPATLTWDPLPDWTVSLAEASRKAARAQGSAFVGLGLSLMVLFAAAAGFMFEDTQPRPEFSGTTFLGLVALALGWFGFVELTRARNWSVLERAMRSAAAQGRNGQQWKLVPRPHRGLRIAASVVVVVAVVLVWIGVDSEQMYVGEATAGSVPDPTFTSQALTVGIVGLVGVGLLVLLLRRPQRLVLVADPPVDQATGTSSA